jgi:outer membrane protein assembly factor BamA
MKHFVFFIFLTFLWTSNVTAQSVGDTVVPKKQKKFTIIPMPVIAANPTTGLMYGIAPGVSWVNGNPKTTSISNFLGSFIHTAKKQLLIQIRGNMFLEGDKWISTTDLRYNLNGQPTYGLSTSPIYADNTIVGRDKKVSDSPFDGPSQSEMMYFDHFRLHQTILKRHGDTRFFYGLGYHLDLMSNIRDKELDLAGTPPAITHHYQYQTVKGLPVDKYSLSGISLNASFDSRDNIANPYKGKLAAITFRINPSFIGSTASSSHLWLEYRDYFSVNKARPRNLIAFWTFGSFVTSGKVPYMFLPATGWDLFGRSGRPYTQGRFRGEDLSYTEFEWRFPLQSTKEKLGAVIFTNFTSASSRTQNIGLFNSFQMGYGAGFRYMLSEKNRVNIAIDYGFGHNGASGLFLNLNEYF